MPAVTLSPSDPNCVFYMDFQDGRGGTARDQSKSGLNGTLNGGPAWMTATSGFAGWGNVSFNVWPSSYTYAPLFGHHISFVDLDGEDVTTTTTTVLDFSGNKEFMFMTVYAQNTISVSGLTESVLNYCQLANSCGFAIEKGALGASNYISFTYPGIAEHRWGHAQTDTRPHSFGVWRNKSGAIRLYYDGTFNRSFASQADMGACSGGSELAFARGKTGADGEFVGKFGKTQIWNAATPIAQADAFFRAWHENHFGGHFGTFDNINP